MYMANYITRQKLVDVIKTFCGPFSTLQIYYEHINFMILKAFILESSN